VAGTGGATSAGGITGQGEIESAGAMTSAGTMASVGGEITLDVARLLHTIALPIFSEPMLLIVFTSSLLILIVSIT